MILFLFLFCLAYTVMSVYSFFSHPDSITTTVIISTIVTATLTITFGGLILFGIANI